MAQLIIQNRVADYDRWHAVFTEMESFRRGRGAVGHRVYRDPADPNVLVIITDYPALADAQAVVGDPELRAAMERAGVEGPPQMWIMDEVEAKSY